MKNNTYYVMSITGWQVCFDGTHEEVNTFIETAIAAGSKDTYIITCEQIPTIKDCKQIRADRFTAQQKAAANNLDETLTDKN